MTVLALLGFGLERAPPEVGRGLLRPLLHSPGQSGLAHEYFQAALFLPQLSEGQFHYVSKTVHSYHQI